MNRDKNLNVLNGVIIVIIIYSFKYVLIKLNVYIIN